MEMQLGIITTWLCLEPIFLTAIGLMTTVNFKLEIKLQFIAKFKMKKGSAARFRRKVAHAECVLPKCTVAICPCLRNKLQSNWN